MEKPQIKFCRTRDGGRLAYFELGTGSPLVYLPPLAQHVLLSWDTQSFFDHYTWLAARHRLVRYDHRGSGLSQAGSTDRRLESFVEDLEDLVDYLELESFNLMALAGSGATAIAYAAAHADRVGKLVLWNVFPSLPAMTADPRIATLLELAYRDWDLFTQTFSSVVYGWTDAEQASSYAALLRASTTQAEWLAVYEAQQEVDVVGLLSKIKAPTLVVQNESIVGSGVETSGVLASGIPNASLRMLEGGVTASTFSGPEIGAWLEAFLSGGAAEAAAGASEPQRERDSSALRTVLFTDIVGHTEMMSRLGDERGREVLREHERITREVLKAHGGTEVKTMGDGFMASFGSVTRAVECAVALQRAIDERNRGVGARQPPTGIPNSDEISAVASPLQVRCGLNAGEPIEEEGDLFGATVILTSRIAARAEGGEILVADTVRGLCSGKGFLFADRGDFVAKGFEEPVRVFEVRWRE